MKNITWNKVKTTVKGWQVGDYIRQTSIVVIGVLITFAGSELVTQNSEKKDIQATMSLIRDELKSNRENYESIVSEFREDERLSSLLVEYDLKHRTIPEDSLIQFRFLMGHIRSFYYSQNALDILKNSMLMQKISDKELLLQFMFRPAVGSVREGGQVPGAAPPDHFIQKTAAACDAAGLVLYLNR